MIQKRERKEERKNKERNEMKRNETEFKFYYVNLFLNSRYWQEVAGRAERGTAPSSGVRMHAHGMIRVQGWEER